MFRSLPAKSKDAFADLKPAQDAVERDAMSDKPYLAGCASLIWLQTTLRADISVHIALLCQVMHDPSPAAWAVLIDLIAYVHYSKQAKITYSSDRKSWYTVLRSTMGAEICSKPTPVSTPSATVLGNCAVLQGMSCLEPVGPLTGLLD